MHEVMFSYLALRPPTGEAAAFFALHGACAVNDEGGSGCWGGDDAPRVRPAELPESMSAMAFRKWEKKTLRYCSSLLPRRQLHAPP